MHDVPAIDEALLDFDGWQILPFKEELRVTATRAVDLHFAQPGEEPLPVPR